MIVQRANPDPGAIVARSFLIDQIGRNDEQRLMVELLHQLKLMGEPHASTPAIALTAYAREDDRQRAPGAGFEAHIGKPFDVHSMT